MMVRVIRKWIAATERRQHAVARLLLLAACLLAVVDGSLLAQTIDAEIVNPGVAGGLFSFDIRITPTSALPAKPHPIASRMCACVCVPL